MKYDKLLENLDKKIGDQVSVRRYTLSDMISESYKALYDSEEGTNLHTLLEAHLDDVRNHPTEIDRLSRQLSIMKEVIKLKEAKKLSDKDLRYTPPKRIMNSSSKTLFESAATMNWSEWQRPYGSMVPEKYYSEGQDLTDRIIGVLYGNDPKSIDPDAREGYQAEIFDDASGDTVEYLGGGSFFDTEEEAKEAIENWFRKESGDIDESIDEAKDDEEELLDESELTDEEVDELANHLAEIRKNKKLSEADKSTETKGYKVYRLIMDVAFPASTSPNRYGFNAGGPRGANALSNGYSIISEALAKIGLEMAGDSIEVEEDLTRDYMNNDYDFFSESKNVDECDSTKKPVEESKSRKLRKKESVSESVDEECTVASKETNLDESKGDTIDSIHIHRLGSRLIHLSDKMDAAGIKYLYLDDEKPMDSREYLVTPVGYMDLEDPTIYLDNHVSESVESNTENKGDLVDKKRHDTVEPKKIEEASGSSGPYAIERHGQWKNDTKHQDRYLGCGARSWVSQGSSNIDTFATEEEATAYMKKHVYAKYKPIVVKLESVEESVSWDKINLSEFNKKSASKAFVKTFKKLDSKLHEGTALTRQESISLYKAANSAMTHLSVELEHNPEFLSTFNEATTLLTSDVNKILESMKNGKAPSKKTMKSLAKFSEALLYESVTYLNGKEVSSIDLDKALDYQYGNDRDKDNNKYTTEEKQKAVTYWIEKEDGKHPGDLKEAEEEELPPIEDEEIDDEEFVGDDEGDIASEESEEFDQEYADARVELHKELMDEHGETEDIEVQEKIAQDAEEVESLPGITDEQVAEIEDLHVPEEEESPEEEPSDEEEEPAEESVTPEREDSEEGEEKPIAGVDTEITDDELAELKKHLTEMRKAKRK